MTPVTLKGKKQKEQKMKILSRSVLLTFCLLGICVSGRCGTGRHRRQVIQEGGLTVIDWWLSALYKIVPSIFSSQYSVPTPIMFTPYINTIAYNIFQGIPRLPTVVFDDHGPYSFNKLSLFIFGVNIFQLVGITFIAFVASIALVASHHQIFVSDLSHRYLKNVLCLAKGGRVVGYVMVFFRRRR